MKTTKTLMEKVDEKFPTYSSEVLGLSVQQLEQRIVNLQKQLQDSETHKEENKELQSLSEKRSELLGPYRDVKSAVALKTKYLVSLIKEKGGQ